MDHPDDVVIAFAQGGNIREDHVCPSSSKYVKHTLDLALEVCDRYDVPGFFFDGPGPQGGSCVCGRCVARMKAAGRDAENPADIAVNGRELSEMYMKAMREPENLKRYYKTVEVIDDAPVICGVECKVRTGGKVKSVRGVDSGQLHFTEDDGYACFTIDKMHIHEMVSIELE